MFDNIKFRSDGTPLYVQIRQQVLAMIGRGDLVPGQQLPTMRAASVGLKVNMSVIQQAFDELERDGFIVVQRGRGTFVADKPPKMDLEFELQKIDALAEETIAVSLAQGLLPQKVGERIIEISISKNPIGNGMKS